MIEVNNLYKSFGAVEAVKGVSFSAKDGQVTGVLGPNGAGKTTSLRMITGLIKPDSGQVRVDQIDPAQSPIEVRRRLGVLPDARGLYRHLTTMENLQYFGALHGLVKSECRARAEQLIEQLGMEAIAHRRTEGFSLSLIHI